MPTVIAKDLSLTIDGEGVLERSDAFLPLANPYREITMDVEIAAPEAESMLAHVCAPRWPDTVAEVRFANGVTAHGTLDRIDPNGGGVDFTAERWEGPPDAVAEVMRALGHE